MIHGNTKQVNRVIFYNDGNNLFRAVHSAGWFDVLWVDLASLGHLMSTIMDGPPAEMVRFKHFTARPCDNPAHINPTADPHIFDRFITANRLSSFVQVFLGRSVHVPGQKRSHEEKGTDVNLAYQLASDAHKDVFDTAVVISGDTDFAGMLKESTKDFPSKRFVIAGPPLRQNRLSEATNIETVPITYEILKASQLPNPIMTPKGCVIRAPSLDEWRTDQTTR